MTTSGRPACGNLAGHPIGVNTKMITNKQSGGQAYQRWQTRMGDGLNL